MALADCQNMHGCSIRAAKTVASGSAAGSAASGERSALERCDSSLGTVSLIENVKPAGTQFSPANASSRPPPTCCAFWSSNRTASSWSGAALPT